jgi:hypothetical protein
MPTVQLSMLAGAGAQFFSDNGRPLSGGKLYTYAAGTTTPQAAYTTEAGNVAHSNPIQFDAAGRVPAGGEIWLEDAVSYKFVLTTSADVLVGDWDDITGNASGILSAFSASTGSSLLGFIQNGADAVTTTVQSKLREWVSVKDFGAVGDGATDDAPSVQAALDYCVAQGHGSIFFPSGNYVTNSPVGIDVGASDVSANIEIFGTGPDSVIISNFDNATSESGMFYFVADEVTGINLRRISVHDLRFNANNKRGPAIFGRILTICQFYNLWIGGFANDSLATQPSIYLKNCASGS